MAKSKYELKTVLTLIGTLDKNDDGEFIVTIEKNDEIKEYNLTDILDNLCGQVISLTSES